MTPTIDFIETLRERVQEEPEFGTGMLREALSCIRNGEVAVGRILLCDYVEAVIGFSEAARRTGQSQESLMHTLSRDGNAHADDLLDILAVFAEYENIELDVRGASLSQSEQIVEA